MGRAKHRSNAKGRNDDRVGRDNAVLIVRRSIWQTPQISAASPNARALLFELLSMHNGRNNGSLFLSVRDATERLGFSDFRPASAAFDELQALGLITCTIGGHFSIKCGDGSRAAAWRLNWIDSEGKLRGPDCLAPLDLGKLEPRARKRMERRQKALKRYHKERDGGQFAVVESTTLEARRVVESTTPEGFAVVESTTPSPLAPEADRLGVIGKSTTHIDHHSPRHRPEAENTPSNANAQIGAIPCERCGDAFASGDRGESKRFCSERCRKAAEAKRRHERRKAAA